LDFSPADRAENLRRIAHISKLLNDQGIITICSFVSPDSEIRDQVAEVIGENNFFMVYIDADINYCRKNDAYGLYKKADKGEISYLPGVDMKFDPPTNSDIIYYPEKEEINPEKVIELLAEKGVFSL